MTGASLERAPIDHLEGDVNDDGKSDIGDPALLLEHAPEQIGGDAHQRDRQQQAEGQDVGMLARGARDREHVVQRHRDVGRDDLQRGLAESLSLHRRGARSAAGAERELAFVRLLAQLSPHLPAYPEQQHAAGEQQADHLQKLGRNAGKDDAEHSGGSDADDDGAAALLGRQARRGKADDDGVVAGQNEVDQDDLKQRAQRVGSDEFSHD